MKRFLVPFIVMLLGPCGAVLASDIPGTMRVDYYHTGNRSTEIFSLDRVVIEPLRWPGNTARPIDRTLRGKYLFEIVDKAGEEILYSRSYNSVYGEWETTGEARSLNRTFHESLRFPLPAAPFEVVVSKRDPTNEFAEVWRTEIDPADYLVHRETAAYANDVVAIEYNGLPAGKVDILLLGDGYTAAERESFLQKATDLTEFLFSTSPFRERREDFNVWALAPAAEESGVSRPSSGIYRDSPFGSSYDAFRLERYALTYENKTLRRIASSAPYEFIEILMNSETYGGGGIYGQYSSAAANNDRVEYLFIHEFGHHFAGLADEYYTSSVAYEAPEVIVEPYQPNVTALLDPATLKWKHLVDEGTPLPTPWPKAEFDANSLAYQAKREEMRAMNVPEAEMSALSEANLDFNDGLFSRAPFRDAIGAFEGANYLSRGYYRPEQNCIMFTTRPTRFCSVCSASIEQVIDEYTRP